MENVAIISEITVNTPGVYVGRVEEGVFYRLSFDYEGDGTLRFWIVNENNITDKTVINRNCDLLTTHYNYSFTSPRTGIITYHIRSGKVKNLTLNKYKEGDVI